MRSFLRRSIFAFVGLISFASSGEAFAQNNVAPPTDCQPNDQYTDNTCNVPASAQNLGGVSGVGSHGATGFVSPDHRFLLSFQTDGNLVLYFYPNTFDSNNLYRTALWASNTSIPPLASGELPRLVFQSDGNLVAYSPRIYTNTHSVVWASGTAGRGATLAIQNDGNAVILNGSGQPIWNTATCCH